MSVPICIPVSAGNLSPSDPNPGLLPEVPAPRVPARDRPLSLQRSEFCLRIVSLPHLKSTRAKMSKAARLMCPFTEGAWEHLFDQTECWAPCAVTKRGKPLSLGHGFFYSLGRQAGQSRAPVTLRLALCHLCIPGFCRLRAGGALHMGLNSAPWLR